MSILIMTQVYGSGLEKSQKAIALAYADFADDDGDNIYPSIEYMAWKTGYSERSVQRITRDLEEMGILVMTRQGGRVQTKDGHENLTNRYRLVVEKLPKREPFRSQNRGDKMTPPIGEGGDTVSPLGVTSTTFGGDTVSPKPSDKPSEKNHQGVYTQMGQSLLDESNSDPEPDSPPVFEKVDFSKVLRLVSTWRAFAYSGPKVNSYNPKDFPEDVRDYWGPAALLLQRVDHETAVRLLRDKRQEMIDAGLTIKRLEPVVQQIMCDLDRSPAAKQVGELEQLLGELLEVSPKGPQAQEPWFLAQNESVKALIRKAGGMWFMKNPNLEGLIKAKSELAATAA